MTSEQANLKAGELTQAQAENPQYSRISVEPIAADGSPGQGFKVVGRDKDDFSKYHDLAR